MAELLTQFLDGRRTSFGIECRQFVENPLHHRQRERVLFKDEGA